MGSGRGQCLGSLRPRLVVYDERNRMATWLWILIIVVVVLLVLGYFGRGRLSR